MNEIIITPLVNVIWVLVAILLAAALVMNRTHRELLLVSVIVLLIPAPLLTQSVHVQVIESTPLPVSSHGEPLLAPVVIPSQLESAPSSVPMPVIKSKQTFTQAAVGLNYGYNPKPKYPSVARSRGWEGKVVLEVHVSADGDSERVSVSQSSGHDILDDAAVAAVEGWRFVPAKRGDTAVASTVHVPINFKLDN